MSDTKQASDHKQLRPYRAAMYALFLAFILTFIGLVVRSVALDIYGRGSTGGLQTEHPTTTACVDELESLFRQLRARASLPMTPGETHDWAEFTRQFEDRLVRMKSRCVDAAPAGPDTVRTAVADTAEKLDTLRVHLARCGEEGEHERKIVAEAIANLRQTLRSSSR